MAQPSQWFYHPQAITNRTNTKQYCSLHKIYFDVHSKILFVFHPNKNLNIKISTFHADFSFLTAYTFNNKTHRYFLNHNHTHWTIAQLLSKAKNNNHIKRKIISHKMSYQHAVNISQGILKLQIKIHLFISFNIKKEKIQ